MDGTLSDLERRGLRKKARDAVLSSLRALGGEAERRLLLAHAEANGGFSERELTATARDRRLVDHELSWSLTNLRRDGLVENPRRSVWALAGAAAESTAPPMPITVAPEGRVAELRAMPYREYLRTPEWRKTRAAALHRANHQCAIDPAHTDKLQVHHRTYDHLGAELEGDLLVLCEECHRVHHSHHGRPSIRARQVARRTAKRKAIVWDFVFRACLAGGLLVGLLGILER
jgi:restriction endonuclease Mrr